MFRKIYFGLLGTLLMLTLGIAFFFYPVPIAHAAAITVNNLSAGSVVGQCTLRDAILAADANATVNGCSAGSGADTIGFGALSGTIVLTASLPTVSEDLTIDGSNNITISGNDLYRVFNVSPVKFDLKNITIQSGKGNPNGGAISNTSGGTVTISNTIFLSNTAPTAGADGGAIENNTSTLNIWNSTFRANLSADQGGAIHVASGNVSITGTIFISNSSTLTNSASGGAIGHTSGVVTVMNSSFSLNRSSSSGGAINSFSVTGLSVTNTSFDDNATNNGSGGAINNDTNTQVVTITTSSFSNNIAHGALGRGGAVSILGRVTISNSAFLNNQSFGTSEGGGGIFIGNHTSISSTISNSSLTSNSADVGGGGIWIGLGALAITNTTLSGNTTNRDGGGIYSSGTTTTTLNNVTLAYNIADNDGNATGDGGGIFKSSGTLNVKNTIIGNNTDKGGQAPDCGGTLVSQGYNFLGLATGCIGFADSVNNDHVANPTDPLLQPLQYYGGTTLVHALQASSIALNNGNNLTCATTDQRGVARPVDGTCDIGAFEGVGSLLYLPLILR